jgi:hypothetical protein
MTISIRRHIDSQTLVLPELVPMIGRDVHIIIVEDATAGGGKPDLTALECLAGKIDLDYQDIEDLRARSVK